MKSWVMNCESRMDEEKIDYCLMEGKDDNFSVMSVDSKYDYPLHRELYNTKDKQFPWWYDFA